MVFIGSPSKRLIINNEWWKKVREDFALQSKSYFVYLQPKLLTMRRCRDTGLKTDEERYGYTSRGGTPQLKENTL